MVPWSWYKSVDLGNSVPVIMARGYQRLFGLDLAKSLLEEQLVTQEDSCTQINLQDCQECWKLYPWLSWVGYRQRDTRLKQLIRALISSCWDILPFCCFSRSSLPSSTSSRCATLLVASSSCSLLGRTRKMADN